MAAKKKTVELDLAASPEADMLAYIRGSSDAPAFLLGSDEMAIKIKGVISTGLPTVDGSIGRGGIPIARSTIIHGGEGGGKTTIALCCVANVQKLGGYAVYIDKEWKLDPDWAKLIGVDLGRLIISQPGHLESCFSMIRTVIRRQRERREAGARIVPAMIVLDSINAALSRAVVEGDVGDSHVAPEARIWSRFWPGIIEEASKERVALVAISQIRKKIGVMFGNDEEIAGGQAARFYASVIMKATRIGKVKGTDEEGTAGTQVLVECIKNQISPPFKKAKFKIRFRTGPDIEDSILAKAEELGLVDVKGTIWSYEGERLGNGVEAAAKCLRKNPSIAAAINQKIRTELNWDQETTIAAAKPAKKKIVEAGVEVKSKALPKKKMPMRAAGD